MLNNKILCLAEAYIYCSLSVSISVYRNLKFNITNIGYYNIDKNTSFVQFSVTQHIVNYEF